MKDILNGFKSQWSKWTAVGLLTILACMSYVYMAKEWSAFRVLLIAVIGITLGLVQSQIPGPSKYFNWQNASKVLVVALAGLLAASFAPIRTAEAKKWISENIDSTKASSNVSLPGTLRTAPAIPVCSGAKEVYLQSGEESSVPLQPGCKSGLIHVPSGKKPIADNGPGNWIEAIYITGAPLRAEDGHMEGTDALIPHSVFQLRGTGTATIRI